MQSPRLVSLGWALSIFLTPLSVVARAEHAAPGERAHGHAGCIIRAGDRLVMVRDFWSDRFGPPGGTADPGETPRETAVRETFEETGLTVEARAFLGLSHNGFSFYACAPLDGRLPMLTDDALRLPAEAFNEIAEARLLRPQELPRRAWRFESQRDEVIAAMAGAEPLPQAIGAADAPTPSPQEATQLVGIAGLRAAAPFEGFWKLGRWVTGNVSLAVWVVLLWCLLGYSAGTQAVLLIAAAALASEALADACAMLRPFHFMPALQRVAAAGFGLPSQHTACATVIWGLLARRLSRLPTYRLAASAAALVAGLSYVYFGVHFFHDIVAGWALGAALLAAHDAARTARLSHRACVLALTGACLAAGGASLALQVRPATVLVLCGLAGFGAALPLSRRHDHAWPLGCAVITLAGMAVIEHIAAATLPHEATFHRCVLHACLHGIALGLWPPLSRAGSRLLFTQGNYTVESVVVVDS
jgi:8-oxo-dGTP pyrophosphatase MutT (NUDIX family)/membrane-associated phospholipid phosphatase